MRSSTKQLLAALAAGIVFGLGLVVSQMVNPAKIVGFLDVTGKWDPTLLFVMGGALAVTIPGFRLVLKRQNPLFAGGFLLPTKRDVDSRLIGGAALFGVGWGLAGFCPGPAITALVTLALPIFVFFAAMLAGEFTYDRLARRRG